jgi:hypothetical protein
MYVLAVAKPVPPRKLTPKDVKRAIQQAHNVCHNSDDTPACRVMWDRVNELSHALARQREREAEDELETREYDV